MSIYLEAPEGAERCDFCGGPGAVWENPSVTWEIIECVLASMGSWAACDECQALIERGDRAGLATRALEAFVADTADLPSIAGDVRAGLADTTEAMMANFFKHRSGHVRRLPGK